MDRLGPQENVARFCLFLYFYFVLLVLRRLLFSFVAFPSCAAFSKAANLYNEPYLWTLDR